MGAGTDDMLPTVHRIFTSGKGDWTGQLMRELIATVIITTSSVALFAYWFRYTCLLILSTKTTRDYAMSVANANQLGFLQVQSLLRDAASAELDALRDSLDRDYKVLTYLLKHAANPSTGDAAIEKRMLE